MEFAAKESAAAQSKEEILKGWDLVRAKRREIVGRKGKGRIADTEQEASTHSHSSTSVADAVTDEPEQVESSRYGTAAEVFTRAETRNSTYTREDSEVEGSDMPTIDQDASSAPPTPSAGLMDFVGGLKTKTLGVLSSPISFGRSLYSLTGDPSEPESSTSAPDETSTASMRSSPPSSPSNNTPSNNSDSAWWKPSRVSFMDSVASASPPVRQFAYRQARSHSASPEVILQPMPRSHRRSSQSPDKSTVVKGRFSRLVLENDYRHPGGGGKNLDPRLFTKMELEGKTFVHIQVSPSFI